MKLLTLDFFIYVSVKDGFCPRAPPYGPCVVTCGADEDCDGSKKCCSNGCGAWCLEPSKNRLNVFFHSVGNYLLIIIKTVLDNGWFELDTNNSAYYISPRPSWVDN